MAAKQNKLSKKQRKANAAGNAPFGLASTRERSAKSKRASKGGGPMYSFATMRMERWQPGPGDFLGKFLVGK